MSRQILVVLFFVSVLLIFWEVRGCNDKTIVSPGASVIVIRDTVLKVIPETCYVYRKAAPTRYTDTVKVIVTHPFMAVNDTSIGKVALSDTFFFPQKVFSTRITRLADSIQFVEKTMLRVDTLRVIEPAPSTWQTTVVSALGALVGVFIGRSIK